MEDLQVIAIAALGESTRFICHDSDLLWHLSDDLKRLKKLTMGRPIIMGRKTFESIKKPLLGRYNIILTRDTDYPIPTGDDVVLAHDIKSALILADQWCRKHNVLEIYIFGGAEIYELALPYTNKLMLTLVADKKPGTRKFPEYEDQFETAEIEDTMHDVKENVNYKWVSFERKGEVLKYTKNSLVVSV